MMQRRRMLMNMASALPPKDTLENTSWANIAIVAAAGKAAEYWTVGDTKTITFGAAVLGSTSIVVKIMGFDYDDLASGGKAPITFGMVDCFATMQAMNTNDTNTGGWGSSTLRPILINTVLPAFETVIGSDIIKPVSKRTSAGGRSSTINITADSVWVPSEYEVFGYLQNSADGEKPTDKSICYPVFTDAASRLKKVGTTVLSWWTRSPRLTGSYGFCTVYATGMPSFYDSIAVRGVAVGFCV